MNSNLTQIRKGARASLVPPALTLVLLSALAVGAPGQAVATPQLAQSSTGLPAEVKRDLLVTKIAQAMKAGNWSDVLRLIGEYRALGGTQPASLNYIEGKALLRTKKPKAAMAAFDRYLAGEGKDGKYYKQALVARVEAEGAVATVAREREAAAAKAAAEREARAKAQAAARRKAAAEARRNKAAAEARRKKQAAAAKRRAAEQARRRAAEAKIAAVVGRWTLKDNEGGTFLLDLRSGGWARLHLGGEVYLARWSGLADRLRVTAYGDRPHYNRNVPAITYHLRITGARLTGEVRGKTKGKPYRFALTGVRTSR